MPCILKQVRLNIATNTPCGDLHSSRLMIDITAEKICFFPYGMSHFCNYMCNIYICGTYNIFFSLVCYTCMVVIDFLRQQCRIKPILFLCTSKSNKTVTECVLPPRCLHATILYHAGVLRHSSLLPRAVLWSVRQPGVSGCLEDQPYVQRLVCT